MIANDESSHYVLPFPIRTDNILRTSAAGSSFLCSINVHYIIVSERVHNMPFQRLIVGCEEPQLSAIRLRIRALVSTLHRL